MKFLGKCCVAVAFVLLLFACQQEQVAETETGYVEATEAYLKHFGDPPQGKEGRAYARVGYLPLRESPDRVRALPIFLFVEDGHLPKILKRLAGPELMLPEQSAVYKPFPGDLSIEVSSVDDGSVVLSMATGQSWSQSDQRAAAFALAETALQFVEIERVQIKINGSPPPGMPAGGYAHDAGRLADVGPPSLVLVAGMWEDGLTNPEEILVEFDRPVTVNSFSLSDRNGKKLAGDYFTSIFNMAVVLLPEHPEQFREGELLNVTWDVTDTLGRSSRGTSQRPLWRYDH